MNARTLTPLDRLLSGIGQFTLVIFLTFFALASGDVFKRKLVRIAGSSRCAGT